MSNNIIQILRANTTAKPTTLLAGQMAWTNTNQLLWIGNPDGSNTITPIGGNLTFGTLIANGIVSTNSSGGINNVAASNFTLMGNSTVAGTISANGAGNSGTAGYALFSGGSTTNAYWASLGGLGVNTNQSYTFTNTEIFAGNSTATSYLTVGANLTMNTISINWVGNSTTSPTMSIANSGTIAIGNSTVTATTIALNLANSVSNVVITPASITVGSNATVTTYTNTTASVFVSNAVVNSTVNTSQNTTISATQLEIYYWNGNSTVNTYSAGLINSSSISIGNSTVNTFANSTHFFSGNSTVYGLTNSTAEAFVGVAGNTITTPTTTTITTATGNNVTTAVGVTLSNTTGVVVAANLSGLYVNGAVILNAMTTGQDAIQIYGNNNTAAYISGSNGTGLVIVSNSVGASISSNTGTAIGLKVFSNTGHIAEFSNNTNLVTTIDANGNFTILGSLYISNTTSNTNLTTAGLYIGNTTSNVSINSTSMNVASGAFFVNSSVMTFSGANVFATSANASFLNMTVSGNFTVGGTVTAINSQQLVVNDNIIELGDGNISTDIVDTGWFSPAGNATSIWYSGLARQAAVSKNNSPVFWLFGSNTNPNTSSTIDTTSNSVTGTLVAYLSTGNSSVGSIFSNSSVTNITANSIISVALVANSLTLTTALGAAYGGTGQLGGYAVGDVLYASAASTLSKLSVPGSAANGQVLQIINNLPAYGVLDGGTF